MYIYSRSYFAYWQNPYGYCPYFDHKNSNVKYAYDVSWSLTTIIPRRTWYEGFLLAPHFDNETCWKQSLVKSKPRQVNCQGKKSKQWRQLILKTKAQLPTSSVGSFSWPHTAHKEDSVCLLLSFYKERKIIFLFNRRSVHTFKPSQSEVSRNQMQTSFFHKLFSSWYQKKRS